MTEAGPSVREIGVVFERVLDQALDTQQVRDALARSGGAPGREQLRRRARQARTAITSTAAVEYDAYVRTRAGADGSGVAVEAAGDAARPGGTGGPLPPPAVLVPALSGGIAALLLLAGYGVSALGGRPYVGGGLMTAGLMAGALAVGAGAADVVWTWATGTAARDHPAAAGEEPADAGPTATRAREAWELAMLERGAVPFLLGRLEEAAMSQHPAPGTPAAPAGATASGPVSACPLPGRCARAAKGLLDRLAPAVTRDGYLCADCARGGTGEDRDGQRRSFR
ncbi:MULTISPECIES: hypothetical protein [unclassified Streptomyces]|uniref:hypothetical protein n=1 Tax=unclassified Streptomyces TaxID=2593676 RepID=UPI001F03CFF2|nr:MULTISPECIES: hypothetical protein [unclassified Streptomyces]MCH0564601.1 hypothetical protein [Streptomyces sp. MUM 2J]MCH0572042.1 hypothetical protein [Streptomyces sp. MUM 136J]